MAERVLLIDGCSEGQMTGKNRQHRHSKKSGAGANGGNPTRKATVCRWKVVEGFWGLVELVVPL